MTEGLFDRYFRLLAGQLPPQEYGVLAEPANEPTPVVVAGAEARRSGCLC